MPTLSPPILSQPSASLAAEAPRRPLERVWRRLRQRPFPRLVAHFAAVILQTGQESGASELNLGIGGLLAVLAAPGGFTSLMLLDKYSSLLRWLRRRPQIDVYWASLPDKYFFIVLSMAITGVVVAIKWDKILPGRQDYANLAPLPLHSRTIFLANLSAIILLASIFSLDVNAVSAVLFPGVVLSEKGTFPQLFAFIGVHALCVLMASAFIFFACFALLGALMSLLPIRAFRTASLFVRLAIIVALILLLSTSFTVRPLLDDLAKHPDSPWRFLPSLWYLGLYQWMQGRFNPLLQALAWTGLKAAAASVALAMFLSALSYRRHFVRIPESADSPRMGRRRNLRWMWPLVDRTILKSPFQRACYHFTLRALFRSEIHCILFGGFTGLGIVVAAQMAMSVPLARDSIPGAGILAAPLAVAYFMIIGLRFVFDVPAGWSANWVYRLILDRRRQEIRAVARKLLLSLVILLIVAPVLIAYSWIWGFRIGLLHAAYLLAISALLIEILLLHFRKIPFTCTLPLFENDKIMFALIYFIAFFLFTSLAAGVERWMLEQPLRFIILPVFLALCWDLLRRIKRDIPDVDMELKYEESAAREVQALNILTKVN